MKRFVAKRAAFALLAVLVLAACTSAQKKSSETSLSAGDFSDKMQNISHPQVLDVRTPREFDGGHLQYAVNIDWNNKDFETRVAQLDKVAPVFVYCLSGIRSAHAAKALRKMGFAEVYELEGGLVKYSPQQLPFATNDAAAGKGMTLQQYKALLDSDKMVLVDFHAEWCGPCKRMEPYLKKIAGEMQDKLSLVRIDADAHPELCADLGVTGLPTLKLYRNKQMVWEALGYVSEKKLRAQLRNVEQ